MGQVLIDDNSLTAIANSIRAKNGSTDTYKVRQMSTAIDNIPSGGGGATSEEKDVNFIDYDGTIVHSYTTTEFLALASLPENPTHQGLISQGWNWTFSNAQAYVRDYGKLWIGQMYVTDDGKTRLYIHLEEGRLEPYIGFSINGTATIEWGDNTTSTVTSTGTIIYTQHTYSSAGDYVISISSTATITIVGKYNQYGSGNQLISKNKNNNEDRVYQNCLYKVELGSNIVFRSICFS